MCGRWVVGCVCSGMDVGICTGPSHLGETLKLGRRTPQLHQIYQATSKGHFGWFHLSRCLSKVSSRWCCVTTAGTSWRWSAGRRDSLRDWVWHVLMHKHRHAGVFFYFLFFGFVLAHVKDFLQNWFHRAISHLRGCHQPFKVHYRGFLM